MSSTAETILSARGHGDAEQRVCAKCEGCKGLEDFYLTRGRHDRTCKECRRAMAMANRAANIDRYRAYDIDRGKTPERQAHMKRWRQSESGRARLLATNQRRDPIRTKAKNAVAKAVLSGRVLKLACQVCGNPKSEGHHPDYDRPLDVVWLCQKHHREVHEMAKKYR